MGFHYCSAGRAGLLAFLASALLALGAGAEEVPFVDGEDWRASAAPLKRAYLIGVSNLLNAEYAYQKEKGPPPDMQTSIQRIYEGIDDDTLDGVIQRLDAFYKDNPDKRDWPVLAVIWTEMVEPNLPESRREE